MTNLLELNAIELLAANNVNSGCNGEIKTLNFNGTTRQRISSQSIKAAIRKLMKQRMDALHITNYGIRSRSFKDYVMKKLVEDNYTNPDTEELLNTIFSAKSKKSKKSTELTDESTDDADDDKDIMMYLSVSELDAIEHAICSDSIKYKKNSDGTITIQKEDKKGKLSDDKTPLTTILSYDPSSECRIPWDIALFGRMFANNPALTIPSALRVSHGFSTHPIMPADDYFTAIDDLNENGAGHIGNTEFTSSVIYKYFAIDLDQLKRNLYDADIEPVVRCVLNAIVMATPTAKQNSYASNTFPDYVNIIASNWQPRMFSSAFRTIKPNKDNDLVTPSIEAYKKYRDNQIRCFTDEYSKVFYSGEIDSSDSNSQTVSTVIDNAINAIKENTHK